MLILLCFSLPRRWWMNGWWALDGSVERHTFYFSSSCGCVLRRLLIKRGRVWITQITAIMYTWIWFFLLFCLLPSRKKGRLGECILGLHKLWINLFNISARVSPDNRTAWLYCFSNEFNEFIIIWLSVKKSQKPQLKNIFFLHWTSWALVIHWESFKDFRGIKCKKWTQCIGFGW